MTDPTPPVKVPLLIAGEDRAAASGVTFERRDPITGDIATIAAAANADDARAAADAAAAAFPAWAATGPGERRALLNRAATTLKARGDEIAGHMLREIGSTAANAQRNLMLGAAVLREAAALTTHITGEIIPSDRPDALSLAVRRPVGVVLGIAPWNAPIVLGVRAVAAPLACGNTVVLKASELCPATHRAIGTAFQDAGFPPGVVNVILNAPADAAAVVEALIAHPAVRRVNFTGSSRTGRRIAALAAQALTPVLLELGGKSPLIVLDDADLDAAVGAAAFGAFSNQGQICMSTERVVVEAGVADAFVDRFAARARAIRVGDPRDPASQLGGLVSVAALDHVWRLIDDAIDQGARLITGGRLQGTLMAPAIVDHVTDAMALYHEESFGPVAAIVRATDADDAVRIANDTEFGLSSAIFSRDIGRALALANRIEAGACHINGATVHNEAQAPFGGMKASGYGRFGSRAEIAEFTDLQWVTVSHGAARYPF